MTDASRNLNLRLPDGRNLSFSDIGTGENGTWIHCHGIPGSRNELLHLENTLIDSGVRVIVADRPGYGQSTPCPGYGFSHHSDDLRQLADHLQLEKFGISGFSGGGVFAMAAAHDLGNRIEQLVIAATPAVPLMENPYAYASELTASTWRAALVDRQTLAKELEALTGSVDELSQALIGAAGDQEEHYLSSNSVRPGFMQSLCAALEQGSITAADALARDSFLIAYSWPFAPEDIQLPVRVIHGSGDRLVHTDHQITLCGNLPDSSSEIISGAHYGTLSAIWG
ncbi:hypothetical protein KEHDKFFH_09735 [Marinobacter maroccanus]|uniref:AB hydrolase-1 domain-containing protein n=1 Tax=Marinobacter maroccanus TaxID=2055143 RepID=A0A2S5Z9X6_9GAMM|nr:alpha/beta hydrolase [Marinobacter maroccanus]PPI84203.1 hypothetical protein KEHDKFFH_09735 [Marinobacter maroccanus]